MCGSLQKSDPRRRTGALVAHRSGLKFQPLTDVRAKDSPEHRATFHFTGQSALDAIDGRCSAPNLRWKICSARRGERQSVSITAARGRKPTSVAREGLAGKHRQADIRNPERGHFLVSPGGTFPCRLKPLPTRGSARVCGTAIGHNIEGFYDPRRRHTSLGYMSPATFEVTSTKSKKQRLSTKSGEVQPHVRRPA
jgi:hypothetical protein